MNQPYGEPGQPGGYGPQPGYPGAAPGYPVGPAPYPGGPSPYPAGPSPYPGGPNSYPGGPSSYPGGPSPYPGSPYPGGPADPAGYGYPVAPQPRKSKTGLIVALVIGLVVAVGGIGGAIWYVADGGIGGPAPRVVVDSFLTAIFTEKNADKAAGYVCSERRESTRSSLTRTLGSMSSLPGSASFSWNVGQETISGKTATVPVTFTVTVTVAGRTTTPPGSTSTAKLVKESGWKICDDTDRIGRTGI